MSTRRGIVRPQMQHPPDAFVGAAAAASARADPALRVGWYGRLTRRQRERRARERRQRGGVRWMPS